MGNRKKCIQAGVHLLEDINESIVKDLYESRNNNMVSTLKIKVTWFDYLF